MFIAMNNEDLLPWLERCDSSACSFGQLRRSPFLTLTFLTFFVFHILIKKFILIDCNYIKETYVRNNKTCWECIKDVHR